MAERREVALVVGGGTGIGYATAQRLIQRGSAVALAGRRESVLTEARDRLRSLVPGAAFGPVVDFGHNHRSLR